MYRILVALISTVFLSVSPSNGSVVTKVGEDLYAYLALNDTSCNSVFLVGSDGILVVDTGFDAKEAGDLLEEIRKISPLPVRYIVNTHYHRDHQAGNGIVGPEAVVISTEWTRKRTLEFLETVVPRLERQLTGADLQSLQSTRFRPASVTFDHELNLYVGKHRVEIFHPGKAHTSGDLLVYFPAQRVMATADLFMNNASPAMDDGSVLNWIQVLEELLEGPAETFVPGHFEVGSKKELRRFHDYLADLRDQVQRLVDAGSSLEDVRRRINMEDYSDFLQYPQYRATFADNAEVIYRELTQRPNQ